MAEFQVEGPELKKLVKLSKKQPLAFAYAPGKKPDERLVAIDRRKTASFLGKNLKQEIKVTRKDEIGKLQETLDRLRLSMIIALKRRK